MFIEGLQVQLADGRRDAQMFQMGAGGFLGFDDEIGQTGNLRLFVRQQARHIGSAQRSGNQVKNRGHNGVSYTEGRLKPSNGCFQTT